MIKYEKFVKDFNDNGYFTGKSGAKYRPKIEAITVKKAPYWEKLILELAFGVNFKKMIENYQKIHHLSTSKMDSNEVIGRLHEIGDIVLNQMKGINQQNETQHSTELALCALFCVTNDEPNEFSPELLKRKKTDWEDIPDVFFSQLSNGIKKAYLKEHQKEVTPKL